MTLIVIPYHDDGVRARSCEYVCRQLRQLLPGIPLILADSGHEPFNRAASRNLGVRSAGPTELVVVCDADTVPDPVGLELALVAASRGGLHYPFSVVNYLTEAGTDLVLRGDVPDPTRIEFSIPAAHGGCMVMCADLWREVGGQDERFEGWGYEDNAWYGKVRTQVGTPEHHRGVAWHLWHPHDRYAGTLEQTRNWLMARRALGT
jgi:N-terminal domain of galactosyltransferase